jgi:hypothetical protein
MCLIARLFNFALLRIDRLFCFTHETRLQPRITTQNELIPSDYKYYIIACKTEHLVTNLVISELNLTCFCFEISDTYYILTSSLIHTSFLYPYPSFLLHESLPHDDHNYVHVYVDVLHERQVTMHVDWGCTLPLHMSMPNQIFTHVPLACIAFSFMVRTHVLVLFIQLQRWSWAQLNLVDPFHEAAPRRLQLDCLC